MDKRSKRKALVDVSSRHLRRLVTTDSSSELGKTLEENTSTSITEVNEYVDFSEVENDDLNNLSRMDNSEDITNNPILEPNLPEVSNVRITNFDNAILSNDNSNDEVLDLNTDCSNSERWIEFNRVLASWSTKHRITHTALSDLLKALSTFLPEAKLPKDPRTFLKTPRTSTIRKVEPGSYCHFGISVGLEATFRLDYKKFQFNSVELKVGIDGLPISDSNTSQLWPILGCVHPSSRVFLIGAYHGYSKPSNSNEFLHEFVNEITQLINHGFNYEDKNYKVRLYCLVCDASAKSFVTRTKGHTGYFGCTKCEQEGEYREKQMCFPDIDCALRTNENFILQTNEEYHLGLSILTSIPRFGMVTEIPLDYMHLVCIGVVKKIINLWLHGKHQTRLQHKKVSQISNNLLSLRNCVTSDFARRPQSLEAFGKWKSTELRQFLLYTAPVVLFKILPSHIYNHFMTLHVAVRILCYREHVEPYGLDYAQSILEHFVDSFIAIYGAEYVSHNIHGLVHLVNDVKTFGPLDNFSAFPFENFMSSIKRLIRKHDQPLQQLHRRYTECGITNTLKDGYEEVQYEFCKAHSEGPIIRFCLIDKHNFKQFKTPNGQLSVTEPDNCCMLHDNTVIVIQNFVYHSVYKCMVVVGQKFLKYSDIYEKPCPSSSINCFYVDKTLDTSLLVWPVSHIKCKCIKLPFCERFVVLPIMHYS